MTIRVYPQMTQIPQKRREKLRWNESFPGLVFWHFYFPICGICVNCG